MVFSSLIFGSFTIHYITLLAAAGVGVAGQQRQQVAALLDFDHVHLMGLDDLNIRHRIGQRFPQIGELYSVAYSQLVYMPEVVRTAPTSVARNDAVGVSSMVGISSTPMISSAMP